MDKRFTSSSAKIAASWLISATICLTGYYFARVWAANQRDTNIKIRQELNEEFGIKLSRAQPK